MTEPRNPLVGGWNVDCLVPYLALVILCSLAVRLVSCTMKALEERLKAGHPFWVSFLHAFRGVGARCTEDDDYWHPFILGVLEFGAYPILMVTGNWAFIGAWLAFKTVARWRRWSRTRAPYNRFLIGNALVLLLSFLVLTHLVRLK